MSPRAYTGPPRSHLEAALQAHTISIHQLANTLGIAYASVHRVAAGQSQMTRARAERFAAALRELGADVEWAAII